MIALYRCGRQGDALDVYTARAHTWPASWVSSLRDLQRAILAHSPALQRSSEQLGGRAVVDPPAPAPAPAEMERSSAGTSAGGPAFPRPLRAPASPVFVGRNAELAGLHGHWAGLDGQTRSAIMLGGEAEIGKTRLTAEFAGAVHREGGLVLYGRCDEGLAVPYQPFVEALRPYATAIGVDRLRDQLGHLAPELGRLLPELARLGEAVRSDPESERCALFEAVAALFEGLTRTQPALLVLDDLHWASQPTLLLVRHLVRSPRPLRVLLLGTHRDTPPDLGQPLAGLLADLQRDATTQSLSIRGLDEHAIAALLEAAVGHPLRDRASQLVHALAGQTAGNPFYLRELLADLVESGAIVSDGGDLSPAPQLNPSERLRHVIAHRIARLSGPAVQALRVAAVAGATFSFVLLERVLGDRATVLDALDEAVAARLLIATGTGDYAFAHALVRDTIYGQLGNARRIHMHRKLGEALETLGPVESNVEALAYHFARAAIDGRAGKAAGYALAAGRSASVRLGHEEATAHYERGLQALALSAQPYERQRCQLLLALGEARWAAGDLEAARRTCRQAAAVAGELGDATMLARAAIVHCGPYRVDVAAAGTETVIGLLERALAALGTDDSALRARLTSRLATALGYLGIEDRRAVLAEQALGMARRVGDRATLADVIATLEWASRGPDAVHENVGLAQELVRLAEAVGDLRLRVTAHAWLLGNLLELGDGDGVQRGLDALQRLAGARPEPYFTWTSTVLRANQALLQGRLDDCERLAHDALAARVDGTDELAKYHFFSQMCFLRAEQGRLHELLRETERNTAGHAELPAWRCMLANIYAHLDRRAQARRELEIIAPTDFSAIPRDKLWLSTLWVVCKPVVFLEDTVRARQLYELLAPYADRCAVTHVLLCQGSIARLLGLLATTLSQYDDAERHFQHALAMDARIGAPLWVAHTQHDYARMLLVRRRSGDRATAGDLLEQALATAERLGLRALSDRATPLALAARAARAPLGLRSAS
jgi:tetratricopeptide (TPR) repeat protein